MNLLETATHAAKWSGSILVVAKHESRAMRRKLFVDSSNRPFVFIGRRLSRHKEYLTGFRLIGECIEFTSEQTKPLEIL